MYCIEFSEKFMIARGTETYFEKADRFISSEVKNTVSKLKINLNNGFFSWKFDLKKFKNVFKNLSIIEFQYPEPTEHILSSSMKRYKDFWYNLKFGQKKEDLTLLELYDCKFYIRSSNSINFQRVT